MTQAAARGALRPARRLMIGVALATAIAGLSGGVTGFAVWLAAMDRGLDSAAAAGALRITFFVDALDKDINRYKLLAKTLSETEAARTRSIEFSGLAARAAAISGAASVRFMTLNGTGNPAALRALSQAYQGVMGLAFDPRGAGSVIVAAPVREGERIIGAVTAWINAPDLEFAWRSLADVLFFTGEAGTVRLSSLRDMHGRNLRQDRARSVGAADNWFGQTIWRMTGGEWAALGLDGAETLVVTRPAPVVGMTAYMLIATEAVRRSALLAALAAGASIFAIVLLAVTAAQRFAALRQRQALEAQAMARLESMVEDRTRELRDAQETLVQAGKMSALGQMAAGIAHELNQPLTAIRSFADNGTVLLDRGRTPEARANLDEIGALTARAARIIKNLRAFARNAPEQPVAVPLGQVVEDAIALLAGRLRSDRATVTFTPPAPDIHVLGGIVRLQQVVMNILANALDAQAGATAPRVDVVLGVDGAVARLDIRDHGPGLPEDVRARVFDPFFTTKADGGKGMGLGLSISYGIVRSFGGDLVADNHRNGGAVFTLTLPLVAAAEGAA